MRSFFVTFAFFIAGLLSVDTWASIDVRLCEVFPERCVPRAGECSGGLDACAITVHTYIDLALYLVGPPFAFAWLGHFLEARRTGWRAMARWLSEAVLVHWGLTFMGTRVLHI
jgi:hypothetical protein